MTYQLVKRKEFPSLLIRNMATTNIKKSRKLYRLYKLYFEKKKEKIEHFLFRWTSQVMANIQ